MNLKKLNLGSNFSNIVIMTYDNKSYNLYPILPFWQSCSKCLTWQLCIADFITDTLTMNEWLISVQ